VAQELARYDDAGTKTATDKAPAEKLAAEKTAMFGAHPGDSEAPRSAAQANDDAEPRAVAG
jgi:hypothetical protein